MQPYEKLECSPHHTRRREEQEQLDLMIFPEFNICVYSIFRRFNKSAKKIPGKGGLRYWKNVGLGFKTPKEAIEGETIVLQEQLMPFLTLYAAPSSCADTNAEIILLCRHIY